MELNVKNQNSVEHSVYNFGDIPPWVHCFRSGTIRLLVNSIYPRMRDVIHSHYLHPLVSKCSLNDGTQESQKIIERRILRRKR